VELLTVADHLITLAAVMPAHLLLTAALEPGLYRQQVPDPAQHTEAQVIPTEALVVLTEVQVAVQEVHIVVLEALVVFQEVLEVLEVFREVQAEPADHLEAAAHQDPAAPAQELVAEDRILVNID